MNALTCGGGRPPLSAAPKVNSAFCGGVPTGSSTGDNPDKGKKSPVDASSNRYYYDPFAHNSTSMARDLLRGFIMTRKASLTHGERGYLEDLAEDGEEDDLNKAMKVLSDHNLFFNPCQRSLDATSSDSTISVESSSFFDSGQSSSLNYSSDRGRTESSDIDEIPSDDSGDNSGDKTSDDAKRETNVETKLNEDLEDNVEIIESINGAIILKDLKVLKFPNKMKDSFVNSNDQKKRNKCHSPVETSKRSRSVPQSMPAKLGTSYRVRRVAERKESSIHSSMWKAHKQGLSLTLSTSGHSMSELSRNSSFRQNLFHGKIKRSSSPFVSNSRKRTNSLGKNRRSNSRVDKRLEISVGSNSSVNLNDSYHSPTNMHEFEFPSSFPSNQLHGPEYSVNSEYFDPLDYTSDGAIRMGSGSRKSSSMTLDSMLGEEEKQSNEVSFASRRHSHNFLNFSSESSIAALDLASLSINDTQASFLFPGKAKELRSARRDSVTSYASVSRGQIMLDSSMTSIASLKLAPPLRQTSDGSIQSLKALCHESSVISSDSSVSLNYFHRDESKKEKSLQAQKSTGLDTSPRHKAPMRPSRNPSPLVRPRMIGNRSQSEGVLPHKYQHHLKSLPARGVSSLQLKNISTQKGRRKASKGKVGVLDTIVSEDSYAPRASQDGSLIVEPIWTSPLQSNSNDDDESTNFEPLSINAISESRTESSGRGKEFRVAETMREKFEAMRKYKSMMSSFTSNSTMDDSFLNSVRGWQEVRSSISQDEITLLRSKMDASSSDNHDSLLDNNDDDLSLNPEERKLYDCWNVLSIDEDEHDFGFTFSILGTSADDIASTPHVLSPPLMESIYHFLPFSVSEQNYFMKYSLLRDGASYITMLQNIRGSQHTILAMETTEGEVFGSFTSAQWRKDKSYFGSGESFLWRMKGDRKTLCKSVIDQALLESDIEVFAWTGVNYFTQLCNDEMIALGGGSSEFGLVVQSNLLNGSTNHSATFGNPPLSKQKNSSFEIVNLEVWTMTPCNNEKEAGKLEMARLFLERHRREVKG